MKNKIKPEVNGSPSKPPKPKVSQIEKLKTTNAKLTAELSEIKQKKDEAIQAQASLQDKLLRVRAELQNIQKRTAVEMAQLHKYEGEEFIKKLLPIVDNFERAIKLDDDDLTDELSMFLEGFKMIYGNLITLLSEMEIKEIECLGQEFDPIKMEAVIVDHEVGVAPNLVIDILQKGYTYKDKIIRTAMVKVNQ